MNINDFKTCDFLVKTNVANSRKKLMILNVVIFLVKIFELLKSKQTLLIPVKNQWFQKLWFSRENSWVIYLWVNFCRHF